MRALIQRVSSGFVEIKEKKTEQIKKGLVIFLGITHTDTEKDIDYIINKVLNLRIFGDEKNDNFEKSVLDINGELLIISQFTLYADTKKGRRPSFIESAKSDHAKSIYDKFISNIKKEKINIGTGIFGSKMKVKIINEGPVTIMIDSN